MKQRTALVLIAAALLGSSAARAAPRSSEAAPAPAAEHRHVKPGGPIAVGYRLAAEPTVGVPVELTVTAHVEEGVSRVAIEVNASLPRALLVTVPEAASVAGGVHTWTLTVVPLAAEAGYLTVVVSGEVGGLSQADSVTVPLASAPPGGAAALPGPRAGNEALIALPVQETP